MNIDARHVKDNLQRFKEFLTTRGADVLIPVSEWELARFKCGEQLGIIYTNAKGRITHYGAACEAYTAYCKGLPWRAIPATPRRKRGGRSQILELRARDGDLCFFCQMCVNLQTESEEHLVARTHGGPDNLANKFLAHRRCNELAGHLSAVEKIKLHVQAVMRHHTKRNNNE